MYLPAFALHLSHYQRKLEKSESAEVNGCSVCRLRAVKPLGFAHTPYFQVPVALLLASEDEGTAKDI